MSVVAIIVVKLVFFLILVSHNFCLWSRSFRSNLCFSSSWCLTTAVCGRDHCGQTCVFLNLGVWLLLSVVAIIVVKFVFFLILVPDYWCLWLRLSWSNLCFSFNLGIWLLLSGVAIMVKLVFFLILVSDYCCLWLRSLWSNLCFS